MSDAMRVLHHELAKCSPVTWVCEVQNREQIGPAEDVASIVGRKMIPWRTSWHESVRDMNRRACAADAWRFALAR